MQVAWLGTPKIKVSWEPARNLKQSVIKEFEDGDVIKAADVVCSDYGKKAYTTIVSTHAKDMSTKKMKVATDSEQELDTK